MSPSVSKPSLSQDEAALFAIVGLLIESVLELGTDRVRMIERFNELSADFRKSGSSNAAVRIDLIAHLSFGRRYPSGG